MGKVGKYYPVQGSNKFETISFPITKAFALDFGAQAAGTVALFTVPKGAICIGISARVTEAAESVSAATLQLGFTGTQCLTSAYGTGAMTLGAVLTHSSTGIMPRALAANDTFDSIVASTAFTAGKAEVYLTYIPVPDGENVSTSDFPSYVTA